MVLEKEPAAVTNEAKLPRAEVFVNKKIEKPKEKFIRPKQNDPRKKNREKDIQ